jgi:2-polyprenyl-3-methyl-5-hydroxy-6-metoxy-1,4-benzoquinol methylase
LSAILDVGCGGGIPIAKYLVEKGFRVTGIDSSEKMIRL